MKKSASALFWVFGFAVWLFACGGGSSNALGTGSDGGDGGGQVDGGGHDGSLRDSGAKDSGGKDGGHVGDGQVGDGGSGPFTIGGTVIGLTGTGLVLQDNNADNLTVSASGAFTFATSIAKGSAFSVTVLTQPSMPMQSCTVTGGTGTVGSGNVTDVVVNCGTDFVIGGTVTGLAGASVVLQDNAGDNLTVTANGTFAFATPVESGGVYAVTVLTQPSSPAQTCTVAMGSGTVGSANVTSVNVACVTNTYTIGGTISGLTGTGLVLQDNAGDNLTVSASGTFTFATSLASGAAYAVTVLTEPSTPTQTCTVAMGTGTVASSNVTSVTITCSTQAYTVGGTIAGLATMDGVVLQDTGGDNLTVSANGTFVFATPVASGATFAVTVLTAPGAPAQTCVVSGGTGTVVAGNVTSVMVNCTTNTYTVGGTISGLAGALVLQDNGGDNLSLTANGTFAFATPVTSDTPYAVTVLTQPGSPSQTCVVTNGSGEVTNANVTTVTIACTTSKYTVGGTVSGLAANESVVLQDNGADNLTVGANGAFTFATPVTSGQAFAVTVLTNPASPLAQTCVVTSGSGTIGAANVTTVVVTCTISTYTVGGTISGLAGTGLVLEDNAGSNLTVTANGSFTFATPVVSGGAYAVTVLTNPTTPWQTCVVAAGTGSVTNANITSVTVTCTTNKYTVGGTVVGLAAGDIVTLQENGGNNLTLTASGAFTFAGTLASGASFVVTTLSDTGPAVQNCSVSGGTGTVGGANVTGVMVNCVTNTYTIGGTVSGLTGTGLVLQDNGAANLAITANGAFAFATPISSDAVYSVTILTQPTSPSQTCVLGNASGTVGAANVTNVTVTCTTNTYTIGGTLSGLAVGEFVQLQNNGANPLIVAANGTFTFTTPIPSGSAYLVSVLTNPGPNPVQACVVTAAGGNVGNANVTSVVVTCTTTSCPAETTAGCTLTATNTGNSDTGTCAAGFTGACSYSCSLGVWTPIANTCAPVCSSVAGPTLTQNLGGWPNSGLAFTALHTSTLQSFVFVNQGIADTITLFDVTANATIATLNTPAGNGAYNPTVNWALVGGHSYQLTNANGSNGKWVSFTGFPVADSQISVTATWGAGNGAQSVYWFAYTNLVTCG